MQVTQKNLSDTNVQLNLIADAELLAQAKQEALTKLASSVRLQGFRSGKAPLNMVEKAVDQTALQTEFMDIAMNMMYGKALDELKLRPVSHPKANVKKFVPFDNLELEIEVEVIGKIKLADYKKFTLPKTDTKVTAKDVQEVIDNLLAREAERVAVERAAKDGDEAIISFKGVDTKTNEPINGAEGKDYPLVLGSKTFIPGFEEHLVGMKTGEEKTFNIVFPKDYGVKALQKRDVTFTVSISKVSEIQKPTMDDAFAAKVGPFKTVADLKTDIEKQLVTEKKYQAERESADQLVLKIAQESEIAIPDVLIQEQIDRMITEQKQNLLYRGQTWQEFLDAEGASEEVYRNSIKDDAILRVKAGVALAEVAEVEKVTVTPEEFEVRLQLTKGQMQDPKMQAELDKPANQRDILSRMVTEKTLSVVHGYAEANSQKSTAKATSKTAKATPKKAA